MQKSLQETIHLFKVTIEDLAVKGQHNVQDIAACRAACKVIYMFGKHEKG